MKQWVALFSQSGSEIVRLTERLGRWPDIIFTNNKDIDSWHSDMRKFYIEGRSRIGGTSRIKVVNALQAKTCNFLHEIDKNSIVTLHGWLRIVPQNICELYEIYNGHPGLINVHPELKGKDPQVRAYEGGYATIGSVVHKVTPEVDEGEILEWAASYQDEMDNISDVFAKLAHTSFVAWEKFFDNYEQL